MSHFIIHKHNFTIPHKTANRILMLRYKVVEPQKVQFHAQRHWARRLWVAVWTVFQMQHAVALCCAKIAERVNGSGETVAWSSNHSCIIDRSWQLLQRTKDKRLNNIAYSSLPQSLADGNRVGEWVVWDAPSVCFHIPPGCCLGQVGPHQRFFWKGRGKWRV